MNTTSARIGLVVAAIIGVAILIVVFFGLPDQWGNWHVRGGVALDWIFSVEKRDNSVAVVWMRNDESDAYCVPSSVISYDDLLALQAANEPVRIVYSDLSYFTGFMSSCKGAENSHESGFHTFVVEKIESAMPKENENAPFSSGK